MTVVQQAPDLQTQFPRRGRETLGGFIFLGRIIDKVRAMQAGTLGEYVGYCEMSLAFLEQTGVSRSSFDALIATGASDDTIVEFFHAHVTETRRETSNDYILATYAGHLDEQDAEEGQAVSSSAKS